MFSEWLRAQIARRDDVGRFAAFVEYDRAFPREANRLYALLRWCGTHEELRRLCKRAHAEWRVARRTL